MNSKNTLSPLGAQALELDAYFTELNRLSSQLERTSIDTDSDFKLAVKLLTQFSEKAVLLEEVVGKFSKYLEEARESSGRAVAIVSEKANAIHQRKQEKDALQQKLNELAGRVQHVVSELAIFNKAAGESQKTNLPAELGNIEQQLGTFIEEAESIKLQAQEIKFKEVSGSAESLQATLQAAKLKLTAVISSIH